MYKREDLLKSKAYWLENIQDDFYREIDEYMDKHSLNKRELSEKMNISSGRLTQILKGNFNHKLGKFVDYCMSLGIVPIVNFVDIEDYIKEDKERMNTQQEQNEIKDEKVEMILQ